LGSWAVGQKHSSTCSQHDPPAPRDTPFGRFPLGAQHEHIYICSTYIHVLHIYMCCLSCICAAYHVYADTQEPREPQEPRHEHIMYMCICFLPLVCRVPILGSCVSCTYLPLVCCLQIYRLQMYLCTSMHVWACVRVCVCVCLHKRKSYVRVYMRGCACTHVCVVARVRACVYVCMCGCTCARVYVCVYVCVWVCADEAGCSGHGDCEGGWCVCWGNYVGEKCESDVENITEFLPVYNGSRSPRLVSVSQFAAPTCLTLCVCVCKSVCMCV